MVLTTVKITDQQFSVHLWLSTKTVSSNSQFCTFLIVPICQNVNKIILAIMLKKSSLHVKLLPLLIMLMQKNRNPQNVKVGDNTFSLDK